ncbi:TIGR01440 family protein [Bacillus spongiae]|uniref:UPF0340 protein WAK64_18680 n=1 Tax=Bacillus spongiae TaxID=2683610 RepID=A0ABU8HIH7_9BACI
MQNHLDKWRSQVSVILHEFQEQAHLKPGQLFIVGCSTSEVVGKKIGTAGTNDVASMLYQELFSFAKQYHLYLAFQCCEHLNRALVIEKEVAEKMGFEEVTVVPVRTAGGAMASYAYEQKNDYIVVEHIVAHGGIDIGDTFIGMHVKHVAVPVRVSQKTIGNAHVTLARTRPKLIGGNRAVYENRFGTEKCT